MRAVLALHLLLGLTMIGFALSSGVQTLFTLDAVLTPEERADRAQAEFARSILEREARLDRRPWLILGAALSTSAAGALAVLAWRNTRQSAVNRACPA